MEDTLGNYSTVGMCKTEAHSSSSRSLLVTLSSFCSSLNMRLFSSSTASNVCRILRYFLRHDLYRGLSRDWRVLPPVVGCGIGVALPSSDILSNRANCSFAFNESFQEGRPDSVYDSHASNSASRQRIYDSMRRTQEGSDNRRAQYSGASCERGTTRI